MRGDWEVQDETQMTFPQKVRSHFTAFGLRQSLTEPRAEYGVISGVIQQTGQRP